MSPYAAKKSQKISNPSLLRGARSVRSAEGQSSTAGYEVLRNGHLIGTFTDVAEARAEIFIRESNDAYRLLLGGRRKYRYECRS